jgi:hypothetical protein
MRNMMKGIFALVIALAVLSGPVLAQKTTGIHGGYIESDFKKSGNSYLDFNKHKNFYVGFCKDTKIIPLLHFMSGLDYYQAGAKLDDNNKLILHYLSVPLGLKLKLGPFEAFGGVHGAVKVSSKLTVLGQEVSGEKFSTFDAGYFVGAGLKILFIGAEVRYTQGFVDVYKGYKNNFWQAGLGLWF